MSSVVYDVTDLAEMLNRNDNRVEIEKKKVEKILETSSANVYLYVSPKRYPEEFLMKDLFFPQAVFLHEFSNYYLVVLAKVYLKLKKCKSIFILLILPFLELIFHFFVTETPQKNILKSADYFYSCDNEIPQKFRMYKNLKRLNSLAEISPKQRDPLNIIFRMCDKVSASSASKRCFNVPKNELIKKTLSSLQKCMQSYDAPLKIFCVADNCSDDIVSYFLEMFPSAMLKKISEGNAKSFCKCVDLACELPEGEQVYFLEDDYLMLNGNTLNLLNLSLKQLSLEKSEKIAIMPDDYPDRYIAGCVQTECRVTEYGHFLKIDKTTCTFATYTDVVKMHKKTFMKFIDWPRVTEDKSVNKVWKKVPLYQPVPGWTLHCQQKSVVPIYVDYGKLKEYFENAETVVSV